MNDDRPVLYPKDEEPAYRSMSSSGIRLSEETNEILPALLEAQKKIAAAPRTSTNPFYNSMYADLAAVQSVVKDPLAEQGILQVHGDRFLGTYPIRTLVKDEIKEVDVSRHAISTRLIHAKTGQWVELEMTADTKDTYMQALGGLFTYLRRQTIKGLLAIPEQDDDGNAASDVDGTSRAAAASRPPANGSPVFSPLGKRHKGEPLEVAEIGYLEWYVKTSLENLDDESKKQYRDKNLNHLMDIRNWLMDQDENYNSVRDLFGPEWSQ